MALTKEQFAELYNKGLSVEQIAAFESGQKPTKPNNLVDFTSGVGKSAAGLIKGIGTIGEKVLSPVARVLGVDKPHAYQDIEIEPAKNTAEKLGQLAGDVAQFAIPGGKIASATKTMSVVPRILARAGGDALIQGVRTGGELQEAGKAGVTSAGVQGALTVASPALRLLGGVFKNAAGAITGRGSDVFEQIAKNPESALGGLQQPAIKTLKEDIKLIRNEVLKLGKRSQTNYEQALNELPKRLGRPSELAAGAVTTVKQGGEKVTLTMQGVKSRLTSLLREHSVEVNPSKKELEFLSSTLRGSEENVLREVFDVVNKWKDTSPAGLDRLAVKIGNYVKGGEQSKQLNKILSSLKTSTRNYLGQRVPQAKPMVARYRQEQKFLKELNTFLGAKVGPDDAVGLKNMAAKLNTLFTKNKDLAREVLESLPGGKDILARQAGRELATPIARSGASIGSLVQSAIQTVVPPKTIGQIAAHTGIHARRLRPFFASLRGLEATERATLLRLLVGEETTD